MSFLEHLDVTRILLWAGVALVLAMALWWLHVWFWVRRLSVPMAYEHEERLRTADGSAIELRRIAREAAHGIANDAPPVVLVHGLAANHRNVDLHPKSSLARTIAARGRDVWLVTLRCGRSDLTLAEHRRATFSAMARHDVPLAVAAVLERTGASQVDYVGFSMGGMLLYAAVGRTVDPASIRRAVFIGSPGRVLAPLGRIGAVRPPKSLLWPRLRLRLAARSLAFAAGVRVPFPFRDVISNVANVAPDVARTAMVDVIEDVPPALQADLARWALAGGELEVDGEAILDGLDDVAVPALFLAGTADRLAPPDAVRQAYEAWGRTSGVAKELVLLGTDGGARVDYAHGDLAVGPFVREEVFEPVVRFLCEERAPVD